LDRVEAHCKNVEVKEEVLKSHFETYTKLDSQHNQEQMKNVRLQRHEGLYGSFQERTCKQHCWNR